MGRRGRYGKYGETKRFERLREAHTGRGVPPISGDPHRPRFQKSEPEEELTFRYARKVDLKEIQEISRIAFGRYGRYDGVLPEWFYSGATVTLLGEKTGQLIGFAMLGRVSEGWFEPRTCELLAIAVTTPWQGRGFGGRLLERMIRESERMGLDQMVLHTAVDNLPARRLFEKAGFQPGGIQQGFYPAGQAALKMVLDLE